MARLELSVGLLELRRRCAENNRNFECAPFCKLLHGANAFTELERAILQSKTVQRMNSLLR